jgi:N-acetylglutamate synthase-like GNAT family acetyltransferase
LTIKIRLFKQEDIVGITKLLSSTFPDWPGYEIENNIQDHWKWKHLNNPLGSIIAVAENNGEIIGCDHEQIRKIKIGNKYMLCTIGADSAVSPDFRQQGIFSRMLKIKDEKLKEHKIELLYSVTKNPILIQSYKKIDRPTFPAPVCEMMKILHMDEYSKKNKTSVFKKIGYNSYQLIRKTSKISRENSKYDLKETNKFETNFFDFIQNIEQNFSWFSERTPKYMNWRFLDTRGGYNKIMYLAFGEKIVGYMIIRTHSIQSNGKIMEIFVHPNHKQALALLIEEAERYFSEKMISQITVLTSIGNIYENTLRRLGYVNKRTSPFISYIPNINENSENIIQFKNAPQSLLHITYGDLDL